MKLAINLYIIVLLVSLSAFAQETRTCIFFDDSSRETSIIDIEGEGYKELPKYRKEFTSEFLYFYIGEREFIHKNSQNEKRSISPKQVDTINFFDVEKIDRKWAMDRGNPTLYIVEKISKNEYCEYTATFIHDFIMIDD